VSKLTLGRGSVSMVLDNGFEALLRLALDRTIPGIVDRMEKARNDLSTQAYNGWPVRSGVSKAGLKSEVRVAPDYSSIKVRLYNDVPYAKYIKSSKVKTGTGSAFVELMRRPTEKAGQEIAAELRPIIEATLNGTG